ncbi:MAG: hypothetical protein ACRD4L_11415 [Pyrinomonadaceae bacterium]
MTKKGFHIALVEPEPFIVSMRTSINLICLGAQPRYTIEYTLASDGCLQYHFASL